MKFSKEIKIQLWNLLEKYDGYFEYKEFCDALSEIIQDKTDGDSFLTINNFICRLDVSDREILNKTIQSDIDACLFSI